MFLFMFEKRMLIQREVPAEPRSPDTREVARYSLVSCSTPRILSAYKFDGF